MADITSSISAAPSTDIWRKPPNVNVFNAPYKTLARKPLKDFSSAQATLTFTPTEQYDQAGLLLIFHPPSQAGGESQGNVKESSWIKTGVELYNGQSRVSTVCCTDWADWSVAPLPVSGSAKGPGDELSLTIRVEASKDHHGPSVWIYSVLPDGTKEALREVCWVFTLEGFEVEVATYAARPAEKGGDLDAAFKDVEVKFD